MSATERHSNDPRSHPWCYWGSDPWPAGVQMLSWFTTPVEMVRWLAEVLASAYVQDDELTRTQQRLSDFAASIGSEEPSPEELRSRLPAVVPDQFVWAGTFAELRNAQGEEPADLIQQFLDHRSDGEEGDARPIRDDELDEFVEFIQSYGY
jgi:hypothetical protein